MAPKGRGSGRNKKLTLGDYVLALVENAFGYGRASKDTIQQMANLLQTECILPCSWQSFKGDEQYLLNQRLLELHQLVSTTASEWLNQETSDIEKCAAHLAKSRYRKCAAHFSYHLCHSRQSVTDIMCVLQHNGTLANP